MLINLLDKFRIQADVFSNSQFCGNWEIQEHSDDKTCFHMVTLGKCQLVVDHESYILDLGDLVIFPREIPHFLRPIANAPETRFPLNMFPPTEAKYGTALLCGSLNFEHQGFEHVLNALPPLFIIKRQEANWLEPLFNQIQLEVLQPQGSENCILNRLSELLFFYALRHHVNNQKHQGFFNLFSASELQPALNAMKSSPDIDWSLSDLANSCNMSRTKFSQLFKIVSGQTVNEFFTWWRMQLAFDYLRQGYRISNVAEKVGYKSDSSFSRAFKKCFQKNPSQIYDKYKLNKNLDNSL